MNVVGLITEYNPFHNGHDYHLRKSKEINTADYTVVVMSGNYVQRGTPAIIDKYTRTKMALSCGADLVLELPLPFATASAETFSFGAVSILEQIGMVDSLCFGSELGDTTLLNKVAKYLVQEPDEFKLLLKEYTKQGMVFPTARSKALCDCFRKDSSIDLTLLEGLLTEPNNILGIEYCKALHRIDSSILPKTITRIQSGYHQEDLNSSISSATALRKELFAVRANQANPLPPILKNQMPAPAYDILQSYYKDNTCIHENDFSLLLKYKLLFEDSNSISKYFDVSKDLAKRIYNELNSFTDYSSFVSCLKTKELTHTRIQRALLHILLEITPPTLPSYVRVLGINKNAKELTSSLKKQSSIPIITSVAKAYKQLPEASYKEFEKEIRANNLYESIASAKSRRSFVHEATRPIIIKE